MALSLPQASEQLDIMLQAASKLTLKEEEKLQTDQLHQTLSQKPFLLVTILLSLTVQNIMKRLLRLF